MTRTEELGAFMQCGVVLGATLIVALAAKVSIPFYPVPMTLQTLSVILVGMSLGSTRGTIAMLLYLVEGLVGLPVFSSTTPAGPSAFVGPTAGFLVGFVLMAWIAGAVAERTSQVIPLAAGAVAASAVLYLPGLAWPALLANAAGIDASWTSMDALSLLNAFAIPFLLGDALKAVLAAMVVAGAMRLARQ